MFNIKKDTQLVTKVFNITRTQLVTKKVYNVTRTSYPLQSSTQAAVRRAAVEPRSGSWGSTDGGDNWIDTGWVNASSCTVTTTGSDCGFSVAVDKEHDLSVCIAGRGGRLNSCTVVAASTGPNRHTVGRSQLFLRDAPTVAAVCFVRKSLLRAPRRIHRRSVADMAQRRR